VRRGIAIAIAWLICVAGAIGLVVAARIGGGLADDSEGFSFIFVGLVLVVAAPLVAGTFLAFMSAAVLSDARGTRYDGEHTVATYTEDLRGQVDLQAISVHTVAAVAAAVRPRGTSLWLRGSAR
jgi:hypothetical protein